MDPSRRKPVWRLLDGSWSDHSAAAAIPYDRDYFHGVTSSYPSGGYELEHPDWEAWMDLICRASEPGRLLDIGCAYGFLVEAARRRGFRAFGVDPSAYALTRVEAVRSALVQGLGDRLPFPSRSMDVVTVFDVVEHLTHPWRCLREALRLLTEDGVLFGATPDPLFFSRREPTHCHERPASYWIKLLEDLGLAVRFRFSGPAYNFQFIACRRGSATCERLGFFGFDESAALGEFIDSPLLACVPRGDWGPVRNRYRQLRTGTGSMSALYVYNPGPGAITVELIARIRSTPAFGSLTLALEDRPVGRVELLPGRREHPIHLPFLRLPEGGSHLRFALETAQVPVEVGWIELTPVADAPAAVRPPSGLPVLRWAEGREAGELLVVDTSRPNAAEAARDIIAAVADLQNPPVGLTATPGRADHWGHVPLASGTLPFLDGSFSMVLCLSSLQEVGALRRRRTLKELIRVARDCLCFALEAAPSGPEKVSSDLRDSVGKEIEAALRTAGFQIARVTGRRNAAVDTEALHRLLVSILDSAGLAAECALRPGTTRSTGVQALAGIDWLVAIRTGPDDHGDTAARPEIPEPDSETRHALSFEPVVEAIRHWIQGMRRSLREAQAAGNEVLAAAGHLRSEMEAMQVRINDLERQLVEAVRQGRESVASAQAEIEQIRRLHDDAAEGLMVLRQTPVLILAWQRLRRRLREWGERNR